MCCAVKFSQVHIAKDILLFTVGMFGPVEFNTVYQTRPEFT